MERPLVTIITPAYNAEPFIRRSIDSALSQSYTNIELVIVDDGSTDKTAEVIKSYKDKRVRYLHQNNQGQGAARNYGIKESRGELITFLDADDEYLADKIKAQAEYLFANNCYQAVYCNALHFFTDEPEYFFKKDRDHPSGDIFPALLEGSLINPNTIMFRREVLERFCFEEGVHGRYSEEWVLYLKVARAGLRFAHIDQDLVIVEIRRDSNTQWDTQWIIKKNTLDMFDEVFKTMTIDEKKHYQIENIIKSNKIKLAVAYLIARKKSEALDILSGVIPNLQLALLKIALIFIPSGLLSNYLINTWKKRQQGSFKKLPRDTELAKAGGS